MKSLDIKSLVLGVLVTVILLACTDAQNPSPIAPEVKVAATVAAKALANGLIVRALPGDVIGICPPLIIEEAEIDKLFDRLALALAETENLLRDAA